MIESLTTLLPLTSLHAVIASTVHAQCFHRPWKQSVMIDVLDIPGTFGFFATLKFSENSKNNYYQPLGIIICRSVVWEVEVLTVGVIPQARRMGLGALLFKKIQSSLAGRALLLEVAVDNIAALTLYRKLGFKPVGRRSHYYQRSNGATVDALVLRTTNLSSNLSSSPINSI